MLEEFLFARQQFSEVNEKTLGGDDTWYGRCHHLCRQAMLQQFR